MNSEALQNSGDSSGKVVDRLIEDWSTYEDKHGRAPARLRLAKKDVIQVMKCHSALCVRIAGLLFQPKQNRRLGTVEVVFFAKTYGFE